MQRAQAPGSLIVKAGKGRLRRVRSRTFLRTGSQLPVLLPPILVDRVSLTSETAAPFCRSANTHSHPPHDHLSK